MPAFRAERLIAADLGEREPVAIAVDHLPQPLEELHDVGMRLVVELLLEVERPRALSSAGRRRVIAQLGIVHRKVDRIEPEAVDTAVQPEARDLEHRILYLRIVKIEIGLLGQEIVQIILAAPRVPRPRRPAEHRLPVVGRRSVGLARRPKRTSRLWDYRGSSGFPGTRRCWSELCE